MKKCPFCAEEIQYEAIKCKHCGEFIDSTPFASVVKEKLPWYFRKTFIIIALCSVGPLALPLIWWRPQTSVSWKVGITIIVVLLSWVLYLVTLESMRAIQEYYLFLDSL